MIVNSPNILIVHLNRIKYNSKTFRDEKINSRCSFPPVLDLKPYSFHEINKADGLLKTDQKKLDE